MEKLHTVIVQCEVLAENQTHANRLVLGLVQPFCSIFTDPKEDYRVLNDARVADEDDAILPASVILGPGHDDFILNPAATSAWVEVDNIAIYIRRTDEGVIVDLYANGDEMGECLASTGLLFSEAESDDDE